MIKQENELASVICDIDSDHLGENEGSKNGVMDAKDQRKKKSEQKDMRNYDGRLKVLDTCEILVISVLAFGMYRINNLKVTYLRVILHYHFGSEKFNNIPNKVELLEAFIFLERIGTVLFRDGGGWVSVIKN